MQVGERRVKEGVQGLDSLKSELGVEWGGWVRSRSNVWRSGWVGIESLGGTPYLLLMETRPIQVAPAPSQQPLLLVQWLEPWAGDWGAGL